MRVSVREDGKSDFVGVRVGILLSLFLLDSELGIEGKYVVVYQKRF